MNKSIFIATIAASLVACSSMLANDAGCCAGAASANMKGACEATFAKLDLTASQKGQMEKLAATCDKSGCTKASMAQMEKGAKGVLTKKQFSAWKSSCTGKMAEKSQS